MKVFILLLINFLSAVIFFISVEYQNNRLQEQLVNLESQIEHRKDFLVVLQDFRWEKLNLEYQIKRSVELVPQQYETIEFLNSLMRGIPVFISLTKLLKTKDNFELSGYAASNKGEVHEFLEQKRLKLLKLEGLRFEASGKI